MKEKIPKNKLKLHIYFDSNLGREGLNDSLKLYDLLKEIKKYNNIELVGLGTKFNSKNNITSVNWSRFIGNDTRMLGGDEDDAPELGFAFGDEKTQEYQAIIEAQMKASRSGGASIIDTDDGDVIDVDDVD
jgi:hypothetical protein